MGKGGSGSTTQTIQPSLPPIANQEMLNSQAQNRLFASSPWMNSPFRSMDLVAGKAPTQYLPQFTPPGSAPTPPGAGSAGASTQTYAPPPPQGQQGIPGFYNPQGGGQGPMQMPGTAQGQQALAQNTSPGLMGMLQFLSTLGQQGAPQQIFGTPPTQPQGNAQQAAGPPPKKLEA